MEPERFTSVEGRLIEVGVAGALAKRNSARGASGVHDHKQSYGSACTWWHEGGEVAADLIGVGHGRSADNSASPSYETRWQIETQDEGGVDRSAHVLQQQLGDAPGELLRACGLYGPDIDVEGAVAKGAGKAIRTYSVWWVNVHVEDNRSRICEGGE